MTKKHMKKCAPSLAIKEMEIKTTLKFHFIPFNSYHQKRHHQQVLARRWGKRNPHTVLLGMQASTTTLENNMETS
jgi:hypothetical protein